MPEGIGPASGYLQEMVVDTESRELSFCPRGPLYLVKSTPRAHFPAFSNIPCRDRKFRLLLIWILAAFSFFGIVNTYPLRTGSGSILNSTHTILTTRRIKAFPKVDVFYYFLDDVDDELQKNRRQRYSYIVKRMFWVLPLIVKRLSGTHPYGVDTRVHIVSNSEDVVQRAFLHGYFGHRLQEYKQADKHWLQKIKASLVGTVSPYEYEITIVRWLIFSEILKSWNDSHFESEKMTRLLFLDGDVMMMINAARFFDTALTVLTEQDVHESRPAIIRDGDDLGYELISFGEGVCNLFSPHGLHSYANFIRQWFRADVTEVVKESKALGGIYFSDMELQRLFTNRNATYRLNYLVEMEENSNLANLLMQCIPSTSVEILHKKSNSHFYLGSNALHGKWYEQLLGNSTESNLDIGVRIGGDTYPQCFIHFQGIKNKPLLYLYGRAFENLLNAVNNRTLRPFEMEPLQPEVIFQPVGSRSIYYVNSTLGTKQHIASMDVFYEYNFSAQDIIFHVPVWLSDMFPTLDHSIS